MNNRNSGYILKPKKFLPESLNIEKYDKPKLYVVIKLLSINWIQKLVKREGIDFGNNNLTLECYVIGSKSDIEMNKVFKYNFKGNLLKQIFKLKDNIIFEIYESDLSFIFIKLYYDNILIGRGAIPISLMKEGYRNISLYDINCIECTESYLTVRITKNYY
jgi:hypothetical protein